jgi:pyrimidine-nucleoside phosphorylase
MLVVPLIERKRDGGALTAGEWQALIEDYTAGRVPDYQMAALLMAVRFRGLDRAELAALTDAMLGSGGHLDFGPWPTPRVGKHSTGGVGDKVSLVLAPLVAACGVAVPMMSGRGLGHTGGTLDKLEAIPGFRTALTLAEAHAQVERIGVALFSATDEVVPADRKLYALRDVTGTVESVPLIAASIMSKKLAEGLTGLVLDVKSGSGATIPDSEQGRELAQTMIALGEDRGCPTTALVTAMDRPLGRACGTALETEEALLALQGEGPDDLMAVTMALGVEMLLLAKIESDRAAAAHRLDEALRTGHGMQKLGEVIEAQGGNPGIIEDPAALPQANEVEVYRATREGWVVSIEPRAIGRAIVAMGGGRNTVDDAVDHSVGFVISAKPGDRVEAGEPLASIYAADVDGVQTGAAAMDIALTIADTIPEPPSPLVSHRITSEHVEQVG